MRSVSFYFKKALLVVFGVWIIAFLYSSVYAAGSPMEEIKITVDKILDIVRNEALKGHEKTTERRDLIMTEVNKRFDFIEMSKRSMARHWKSITVDQRKEYVDLFSEILKYSYIGRVESYSDEVFLYKKEILKKNKAEVQTAFVKNDQEVPINYRLYNRGKGWFVYDVIIEGVSLVNNYRSQFDPIMKNEKFEGLIIRLHEKLDNMKKADESDG